MYHPKDELGPSLRYLGRMTKSLGFLEDGVWTNPKKFCLFIPAIPFLAQGHVG
jgi:hypothetical protein